MVSASQHSNLVVITPSLRRSTLDLTRTILWPGLVAAHYYLYVGSKWKKDTANNGIKKIKLIDGYGFSTSYDFLADSFRLSPQNNFYLRSTLFEKISITANAIVNPYDYDQRGFPVNKLFSHNGKFYPGRITN